MHSNVFICVAEFVQKILSYALCSGFHSVIGTLYSLYVVPPPPHTLFGRSEFVGVWLLPPPPPGSRTGGGAGLSRVPATQTPRSRLTTVDQEAHTVTKASGFLFNS